MQSEPLTCQSVDEDVEGFRCPVSGLLFHRGVGFSCPLARTSGVSAVLVSLASSFHRCCARAEDNRALSSAVRESDPIGHDRVSWICFGVR